MVNTHNEDSDLNQFSDHMEECENVIEKAKVNSLDPGAEMIFQKHLNKCPSCLNVIEKEIIIWNIKLNTNLLDLFTEICREELSDHLNHQGKILDPIDLKKKPSQEIIYRLKKLLYGSVVE